MMTASAAAHAQHLQVVHATSEFTEYVFTNDSLRVFAPAYLEVPYRDGELRYRILEQDIVRTNSPRLSRVEAQHGSDEDIFTLLADTRALLAQASAPREIRKQYRSALQLNLARRDLSQPEQFLITRSLRIRVYNDQTWTRQATTAYERLSQRIQSEGNHPLSTGTWYKIPVSRNGIYRLDRNYLRELGINTESIDPRNIQLWGTNGYELPLPNAAQRPSFAQIPIIVEGESDGSFGANDAVLFYGNEVNERIFDPVNRTWSHNTHAYATTNFVYLTIGNEPGLRLSTFQPTGGVSQEIDRFRDFIFIEDELHMPESQQRSGTLWFGQLFTPEFSNQVIVRDTLPGFIPNSTIEFNARMAGRSRSLITFEFSRENTIFGTVNIAPINDLSAATGRSANTTNVVRQLNNVTLTNDRLEIRARFLTSTPESRGWVDFINIRAERLLAPKNGILHFLSPDQSTATTQLARYTFSGFTSRPLVMDVTNPVNPVLIPAEGSGNNWSVRYFYNPGRKMVAATRFYTPAAGTAVENQNLRGINFFPDYIIVTAEPLLEPAQRLADYRAARNGLSPLIVTQNQIFHEFSGGVPDPVAIRDFMKFLYDRAGLNDELMPRYLMLFGNATFDYKGIEDSPMENLVFNFQHYVDADNLSRTGTYGSDDFFGFLGEDEGSWLASDRNNRLDVEIGRLPVITPEQAHTIIDKIEAFERLDQAGDWRTLFTFTADDNLNSNNNDRDLHTFNADFVAEAIDEDATGIRVRKLYQFSFPLENTPAGRRVPQGTTALVNQINAGTLTLHFSGHGAEQVLTQQRLFQSSDIPRLTNRTRPMIMVTATCSFGRYDDNVDFSGAEKLMLHDNGGSVAAMTTSRVVFTSSSPNVTQDNNFALHIELTRQMVMRNPDGSNRTIGDVYRTTKNFILDNNEAANRNSINNRKFVLLGDPAMSMGLPEQQMEITTINGMPVSAGSPTLQLRSLDRVTVEGRVLNSGGTTDAGFNGEGVLRVFDASRLELLPNPEVTCNELAPECGFRVQNDILFNGRVSITDGTFRTEFIIPKDIAYSDSLARIHIYGINPGVSDAVGSFSNFFLNGINPDAENTFDGPRLDAYLNDDSFVNGSLVNRDPVLVVDVFSEGGVNTTGAGVGHEIIGTLRNLDRPGQEQTFILNGFYTSALDDFTRGRIEYPLDNLEDGAWSLYVRAWDVFNNVGETEIFFDVSGGDELAIRNVYNYPNPMHNFTRFAFEHNQAVGQPLDVFIRVYTLSGRPVAQIRESRIANGNLEMFEWNGRDDDNNRLAAGTYLYHVRVRTDGPNGRQTREQIERLVIIR